MHKHRILPNNFISSFNREIGRKAWGSWASTEVFGIVDMCTRKESEEGRAPCFILLKYAVRWGAGGVRISEFMNG